ncbi:aminotransferase class III-fold pyridoxal phosphate-dependent enzyme [Vibrio nomapromontoriensis]|uniref:aminotransferase class III-fold pyridoxal phosphate-dependent enzyme n=1 Tax=Vibrio nomapromontoriensis TaxID=2910246 RepID=UPI003D0D579F
MSLTQSQFDAHWMPFSSNREFKNNPRIFASASGHYFTDDKGRKIYDSLSGLWTCGLGHNVTEINDAISKQLKTLDYAPGFQFGHAKSFELAERMLEIMPNGLDKVFFTTGGSDAVESALKIARGYWRKKGQASKTRFVGRMKGYHGVNYGGISVGGIVGNRSLFGQGLETDHLSHTMQAAGTFNKGQPENGASLANELLDIIALHDSSTIAAVIVEPVAGSAGVIPPPAGYLERLKEICVEHDILLIFDEVICAFGRMGAYSAAEAFGVTPDLMTTAKQITNGVFPLGAVLARQEIYDCYMSNSGAESAIELPHGYTYSAHPIGCAAALATLDYIQSNNVISQVEALSSEFESKVHSLGNLNSILDIRNYGLAAGLTIDSSGRMPTDRPYDIAMKMWEKGFYTRFGGDTIQLGIPFMSSSDEIDSLVNALGESIEQVN